MKEVGKSRPDARVHVYDENSMAMGKNFTYLQLVHNEVTP